MLVEGAQPNTIENIVENYNKKLDQSTRLYNLFHLGGC
jgi:hypothetical protein